MTTPTRWRAIIVGLAWALTGCAEIGETIRCYGPAGADAAVPPGLCEAYYDECITLATEAHAVDIDRLGRDMADRVYVGHMATCSDGWAVCVDQYEPQGGEGE